ncbi:hypothetical protein EDD11_008150 [Mortierella claussenii]|nr:hypothetical protein EDD11_008150 [Mortierella claussenii]
MRALQHHGSHRHYKQQQYCHHHHRQYQSGHSERLNRIYLTSDLPRGRPEMCHSCSTLSSYTSLHKIRTGSSTSSVATSLSAASLQSTNVDSEMEKGETLKQKSKLRKLRGKIRNMFLSKS